MGKNIFKTGDKVYNHKYGWGIVRGIDTSITNAWVKFNDTSGWFDDSSLSFTEYTLDGFSQERPINYEEYIGKWGIFWDNEYDISKILSKLNKVTNEGFEEIEHLINYKNFQPLTEEQLKALNLKNE